MVEKDIAPSGGEPRRRWVRRGLIELLLPMQAWRNLRDSAHSLGRTGKMIVSGKPSEEFNRPKDDATVEADRADEALVREGKRIIFSLPAKERFEAMYQGNGWTEEKLEKQKTALRRGHGVRLFLLYLAIVLLPGIILRYGKNGIIPMVSTLAVISFLWVRCLRDFCFYTQLEERALMSFKELKDRLGWIGMMAKATWFLD
jgi:hypothetical protein